MKICKRCSLEKDESEFTLDNSYPDKLHYVCRLCKNEISRAQKFVAKRGQKVYASRFFQPEMANPEVDYHTKICDICDEKFYPFSSQNVRCQNCTSIVDNVHRKLNPGKGFYHIARKASYSAKIEVARIFLRTNTCAYCGGGFTEENPKSVDHILPICKGGDSAADNIAICCLNCNRSKAWLTLDDWLSLCKRVCETQNIKLGS